VSGTIASGADPARNATLQTVPHGAFEQEIQMNLVALVLTIFGGLGAAAASVTEGPRYVRWWRRWNR
jgi:hypothetical protein